MANEPQRSPALLPAALVAVLLALVVLVAPSVGSWDFDGPGVDISGPTSAPEEEVSPDTEPESFNDEELLVPPEQYPGEPHAIWGIIATTLFVLAGLAVAVMLVLLILRNRRTRAPQVQGGERDVAAETSLEDQVPIMRAGTEHARSALTDPDVEPAEAIIAAWLALEDAAARSGMRREPSDTPTELTVQVLQRTQADPGATTELLRLYHRARFGVAPVGPSERAGAVDALNALAASWDVVRL